LGKIRLVKNATIGGSPSWADIDATDSIVEIDTAGTISGGKELVTFPLAGKNDRGGDSLVPFDIIIGPNETVTMTGSSANSATINGSLLWKELF